MFCTALNSLQSPQNVGMIVRSHVALGGDRIVMLGYEQPWKFGKGAQAFSRKLEKLCEFIYLPSDDAFFAWCSGEEMEAVALEVRSPPTYLDETSFAPRTVLIVGRESTGLPNPFLNRCGQVVTIPQFGPVGSLNVAVACALAMYEFSRGRRPVGDVVGHKFAGEQAGE